MSRNDPATPPDPTGGWSSSVRDFPNALIVPHEKPEHDLKCGVFTATGEYVPRAAMWMRDELISLPPETVPPPADRLSGEWLWGGVLYGHFGHFLTESLSRLWAVPDRRERLEGVLVVEKYPSQQCGQPGFATDMFRLLLGDLPVVAVRVPTEVECLHVPGPGFGLGRMSVATRPFRRFIAENLARDIAPEGPENLFVTRSQLALDRDGFFGEAILDDRFARAGYHVFCPERHDVATQIARYRAARQIVGIDGSAFHLAGLVARGDQAIGVIARRQRGRSRAMFRQIEAFSGRAPHVIDAIGPQREWVVGRKSSIRDFDMARLGARLKKAGLIARDADWGPLTDEELAFAADERARAVD